MTYHDYSRICRWSAYCKYIYNNPIAPDLETLNDSLHVDNDEVIPIKNSEVELAIKS